jgi:hypothetical protein
MSEQPTDWVEEGRKAFIASKLRPDKNSATNYPTQDCHTPRDEADYVTGWNTQKAMWDRGEGLSGMESYAQEIEEQRRKEREDGVEIPTKP